MTPQRWQQITDVFEAALDREPAERSAFLAEVCAGDEALRLEVESLLSAHKDAGSFIAQPALVSKKASADPRVDELRMKGFHENLTGQLLGYYKIEGKLGEGGMGVVYKARDTRLGRSVAIKLLSRESVVDPERKKRFTQEARAASALNHPNIVTIYDIGQVEGIDFIAMEYVDGKTLERLIPRKGMRVTEALKYAVQIADALAAAHGAGIIHRDLKPSNIMVTENGLVKVLDFGLAKLAQKTDRGGYEETQTMRVSGSSLTEEGMILGTVTYMSPEQAEGKTLDARSDIFSFGSILYEMLTGQKAFQGDSKLSIMTAILREEPRPAGQIVKGLPEEAERIIVRCLRKEAARRFQTMADLRVALEEFKAESDSGPAARTAKLPSKHRRRLVWITAVVLLASAALASMWISRSASKAPRPALTALPLTSDPGIEYFATFSPDGSQVAYLSDGGKGDWHLCIMQIGTGTPLRRTNHVDLAPAWSPDGRFVAALRRLSKDKAALVLIPVLNGPERRLAEIRLPLTTPADGVFAGLSWFPNGRWLVTSGMGSVGEPVGLFLVSAETGEQRRLTSPPADSHGDLWPTVSPDGLTVAFTRSLSTGESDHVYLLRLSESHAPLGEPRQLTFGDQLDTFPVWTATGKEIVFNRGFKHSEESMWRMEVSGSRPPEPIPMPGGLGVPLAISHQGNRLVCNRGLSDIDIWRAEIFPQKGTESQLKKLIASTRVDHEPRVSPDGKRIGFVSYRTGTAEIWVSDSEGTNPVQLTFMNGPQIDGLSWSPDGKRIGFASSAQGTTTIYLTEVPNGKPEQLVIGSVNNGTLSWSRDGRWIYFASGRSGQIEVWKRLAEGGVPTQVTRGGGFAPVESKDGNSLYFLRGNDVSASLWSIPTTGGQESKVLESVYQLSFAVGRDSIYFIPQAEESGQFTVQLFSVTTRETKPVLRLPQERYLAYGFDVSPDERWILCTCGSGYGETDLMLVENFQ